MPLHQQNFPGPLSTVAIIGPGLIGGSLALALRQREPGCGLRLWARSSASVSRARVLFPETTSDLAEAVRTASVCVLCTPIGSMPALAERMLPHLAADAVVTDAGSAKGGVVRELEGLLGGRFVGSHPMAGSEKSGLDAARADLFEGAVCIVTPTAVTRPEVLRRIREFWESVGCRTVEMTPAAHDDAIARVSHLPHAVAAVLVHAVSHGPSGVESLAGGGYRDTTRIAASSPALWKEIFLENKESLLAGLDDFTATLAEFKRMILAHDAPAMEDFLTRAKNARNRLP